jgi:hypothetical protein
LPAGSTASDAQSYRSEALQVLQEMREALEDDRWTALNEMESKMLVLLNRYGALAHEDGAVEAALARAKADRDALLTGSCYTLINEQASAYYYDRSRAAGYETVFTVEALQSLTVESFAALRAESPIEAEGFVVGKLCPSYTWYIAIPFSEGEVRFFEAGTPYTVRFPESGGRELTLTCEKLLAGEESLVGIAIFRADGGAGEVTDLRTQRVEITVGTVTGYHIPSRACVTLNGITGVYVFEESTVYFRRISVLEEGEGYVIADLNDPEPTHEIAYLSPNDLVITSGKKLYDGKVYR